MTGVSRPVWPGELSDADRAGLVGLAAGARRAHDWSGVADRLVRLRARGVPVAALSAAVGMGESRLRRVCRAYGPNPASVGDPVGEAGWVDTAAAATVLGVARERVLGCAGRAEADGVAVMAGWTRMWHTPSLPGWWVAQQIDLRTAAQVRRDDRAERVRGLVAGGATIPGAAAEVGVDQTSAYRYLQAVRGLARSRE